MRPPVERKIVGSNPTRTAIQKKKGTLEAPFSKIYSRKTYEFRINPSWFSYIGHMTVMKKFTQFGSKP